jgi:hypothetical protein
MAKGFVFQKPMLHAKTTNKVSKQYFKVPYMTIYMGNWRINLFQQKNWCNKLGPFFPSHFNNNSSSYHKEVDYIPIIKLFKILLMKMNPHPKSQN